MENRILYVYFGVDRLPYKDPECQVHFPNVGSVINGASNVDTIIFDVSKIGGTNGYQYVSVATLPSGTKLYKTLSGSDNQVSLSISQEYTIQSGDLTIALNSYQGGSEIVVDEDTGLISVEGSPIIVATGSIKLSVAYTPTMESDYNPVSDITVQEALALVGSKADSEYVKYGRLVHDLTIEYIPTIDPTDIDTDTYEPESAYQLNDYFDNGIPMGIYDETNDLSLLLVASPTLYKDTLDSPTNLVAIYRNAEGDLVNNNGNYLLVFLSPNNKFYAYTYQESQIARGDDYATKYLVERLIKEYGINGNILNISSTTTILTMGQRTQINRQDCVIKYNGFYFKKIYEDENESQFVAVGVLQGGTQFNVWQYGFTYTKSTYTLTYFSQSVPVYTRSQSDSLYGAILTIDSDYKVYLKDANGTTLSTIDLPLESVVVGGTYDDTTETIILTLQNGSTIDIPVHDLVDGLATTSELESGLATKVDKVQGKGLSTNDFTDADKTKVDNSATTSELTSGLATKQDTLVSGTNIKTINNQSVLGSGNISITAGEWGSISGDIQDQTDLQNELQAIREEAEGKTQTFTLSYLDTVAVVQAYLIANPDKKIVDEIGNDITSDFLANEYSGIIDNSIFNSQSASLTPTTPSYLLVQTASSVVLPSGAMYVLYDITKIKTGDNVYVLETDVPDRWFRASDLSFRVLETQKVDLTNYYAKNADLIPTTTNAYDIGSSSYTWKDLYLSNSIIMKNSSATYYWSIAVDTGNNIILKSSSNGSTYSNQMFMGTNGNLYVKTLLPQSNSNYDLGFTSNKFNNLYLSGSINGMATITQAQYDALVSGGTVDSDTFYFIEE